MVVRWLSRNHLTTGSMHHRLSRVEYMQKRTQLISNIQRCFSHLTRHELKTVCDIRLSHIFGPSHVCSLRLMLLPCFEQAKMNVRFLLSASNNNSDVIWTWFLPQALLHDQTTKNWLRICFLACWSDWSILMPNSLSVITLSLMIRWNACINAYKCNDQ